MLIRDPRLAYLDEILALVPHGSESALDIGSGEGELARRMARHATRVIGIDVSSEMIDTARALSEGLLNVEFIQGDFARARDLFARESFDFVVAVASLHHMPLEPALETARRILRPGGRLVVLGLARDSRLLDYAKSGVALAMKPLLKQRALDDWRSPRTAGPSRMPLADPTMTYADVNEIAARALPGVRFERRLFFRYLLVWDVPAHSTPASHVAVRPHH
jgi:SAM-dependent methyltransferase